MFWGWNSSAMPLNTSHRNMRPPSAASAPSIHLSLKLQLLLTRLQTLEFPRDEIVALGMQVSLESIASRLP